jgi:hypothetical protein
VIDPYRSSDAAIGEAFELAGEVAEEQLEFPQELIGFLTGIRLMEGVPFGHVVPHQALLPHESIRFFYVNRNWLDAAVDGALSLGAVTSADRAFLESVYPQLRAAVDESERQVWAERTGTQAQQGAADTIAGFLMRSSAVSGWPGLHVRAYRDAAGDEELRVLRLERLAPAVLLALFDGVPNLMHLEEPRAAVQFGVDPADTGRTVTVRDPASGEPVPDGEVQVPFRAGSPGVIDVTALRDALLEKGGDVLGDDLSPAELGLQLLQYPYRQVFGETSDSPGAVFRVTVPMAIVRASHGG